VPERQIIKVARAHASFKPLPQAALSAAWWISSRTTIVAWFCCLCLSMFAPLTFSPSQLNAAYVTERPAKSAESGVFKLLPTSRSIPNRAKSSAHAACKFTLGDTTSTRTPNPRRSFDETTAAASLDLPAPGNACTKIVFFVVCWHSAYASSCHFRGLYGR